MKNIYGVTELPLPHLAHLLDRSGCSRLIESFFQEYSALVGAPLLRHE